MSSLIVTDVTLANQETDTDKLVLIGIIKRISHVFEVAKNKYNGLPFKTDKITRLYDELEEIFLSLTKDHFSGNLDRDTAKKKMGSFFRKTDRFCIALIQHLLEQNESKLLENTIILEIEHLLSEFTSKGYMSPDNPRYTCFVDKLTQSKDLSQTDRLNLLKTLFSDIATLLFTCECNQKRLHKRIQAIKIVINSLQLKSISMQDVDAIRNFSEQLLELKKIPDVFQQNDVINDIEKSLSEFTHTLSGFEYFDMSDLKEKINIFSDEELREIKKKADNVTKAIESEFFHDRIQFFDYDNTESMDYEPVRSDLTAEQLALQRENLLLEYGLLKEKIPEKTVIREQLEEMIQNLSLEPDANSLLNTAILLYHEPFPELRELNVIRRQYDEYYIQKAESTLSGEAWDYILLTLFETFKTMGYIVSSRKSHSLRYTLYRGVLEVLFPADNYSILITINPLDELVFRLVHIMDGMEYDTFDSESYKDKDLKFSTQWDHDYILISKSLEEKGIILMDRVKKSPDEVNIQQLTRFDLLTYEKMT